MLGAKNEGGDGRRGTPRQSLSIKPSPIFILFGLASLLAFLLYCYNLLFSILFRYLHKASYPMRKDPLYRLRNTEGEDQELC